MDYDFGVRIGGAQFRFDLVGDLVRSNEAQRTVHFEMDGGLSLTRAHQISDEVEVLLRAAYPHAEIIIHQDPEGVDEPRSNFPRRVEVS